MFFVSATVKPVSSPLRAAFARLLRRRECTNAIFWSRHGNTTLSLPGESRKNLKLLYSEWPTERNIFIAVPAVRRKPRRTPTNRVTSYNPEPRLPRFSSIFRVNYFYTIRTSTMNDEKKKSSTRVVGFLFQEKYLHPSKYKRCLAKRTFITILKFVSVRWKLNIRSNTNESTRG